MKKKDEKDFNKMMNMLCKMSGLSREEANKKLAKALSDFEKNGGDINGI